MSRFRTSFKKSLKLLHSSARLLVEKFSYMPQRAAIAMKVPDFFGRQYRLEVVAQWRCHVNLHASSRRDPNQHVVREMGVFPRECRFFERKGEMLKALQEIDDLKGINWLTDFDGGVL